MGNRAVITTPERKIGLYLHWNGGRDTVEPLLRYCELQGYRPPSADPYGWARMAQVMGNFFGGSTSVGIEPYTTDIKMDPGDNGIYVIEGWKIVERLQTKYDDDWNAKGIETVPEEAEQQQYDFNDMLKALDAQMPEKLRLGELLEADEVSIEEIKIGDEVFIRSLDTWKKRTVIGFGQPEHNRIPKRVHANDDGRYKIEYPDLPYVNLDPNGGDYSKNPNNYITTDTVRTAVYSNAKDDEKEIVVRVGRVYSLEYKATDDEEVYQVRYYSPRQNRIIKRMIYNYEPSEAEIAEIILKSEGCTWVIPE